MSDPFGDQPLPRGIILGAVALVGLTIVLSAGARVSGIGTTSMPVSAAVESIDLRFRDRSDGAVIVMQAEADNVIAVLSPGTNSFVRGTLRGLVRQRKLENVGPQPPFTLTRWADGRLTIEDPATDRSVDLGAFGPTNAQAFAQLLITEQAVK